nr:alpha-amylase [Quercus suber]
MHILQVALSLGVICRISDAATAAEWRDRSIYQIMTDRFARSDGSTTADCDTADLKYCGGSYKGIIDKLDYIQGMGFTAVWISPITQQIDRPSSYHGYWQNDLNALNNAYGTQNDLLALSDALHDRGMLMTALRLRKLTFRHSIRSTLTIASIPTTQLEDCWTGSTNPPLPDLRTEESSVANLWYSWVAETVSKYNIDGIRLDSAMMVNTGFWSGFQNAAGVYLIGEVYEYDSAWVCGFQDYLAGVLNYPLYKPLRSAFETTSGSLSDLATTLNTIKDECSDTSLLGTFSENHDNPRFAYKTSDMALAKNLVAFTMLNDGIPIIYQGQEQHYDAAGTDSTGTDPFNREALWFSSYARDVELYEIIAKLNAARKNAIADDNTYLDHQNYAMHTNTGWVAFRKGKMVMVLTNEGAAAGTSTAKFASGFDASVSLTELLTCKTITVDGSGNISVPMQGGQPRIYYPTDSSNGLCPSPYKSTRAPARKRIVHNRWNRDASSRT